MVTRYQLLRSLGAAAVNEVWLMVKHHRQQIPKCDIQC